MTAGITTALTSDWPCPWSHCPTRLNSTQLASGTVLTELANWVELSWGGSGAMWFDHSKNSTQLNSTGQKSPVFCQSPRSKHAPNFTTGSKVATFCWVEFSGRAVWSRPKFTPQRRKQSETAKVTTRKLAAHAQHGWRRTGVDLTHRFFCAFNSDGRLN